MAWLLLGDKPLSKPMMVSLLTHICVTQPQWVNSISPCTWLNTQGTTWQVEFPLQDIKCVYYVHASTPSHFHSICLVAYIWSSCIAILQGPCLIIGLPPIIALQAEQNDNAAVFFFKYLLSQLYNLKTFHVNFQFFQNLVDWVIAMATTPLYKLFIQCRVFMISCSHILLDTVWWMSHNLLW